ncbi:DUF6236 family protein [Nonomuraea fuscirosea]
MRRYGLYYPYIHIRDDAWLKACALYWPKIVRMVPDGYPTRDSETMKVLAGELGFDFRLTAGSTQTSAAAVTPHVQALLAEHGSQLAQAYGFDALGLKMHEVETQWALRDTSLGITATGDSLAGVYEEQVDPRLRDELTAHGLAAHIGPWVAMHPHFAWWYMSVLANHVATANQLQPVCDQIGTQAAAGLEAARAVRVLQVDDLEDDDLTAHPGAAAHTLGLYAVRLVVPDDLDNIPVETIVKIRQRYAADFDAFGVAVEDRAAEIATQLSAIQDRKVVESLLRDVAFADFGRPVAELRKALKALRVDTRFAVINLKIELPGMLTALGAFAAGVTTGHEAVGMGAAAALALVQVRRNARAKRAEALAPSSATYLLHVEDEAAYADLVVQRVIRRIGRGIF